MLVVKILRRWPQNAAAACSLISPEGDGYWSHKGLVSTAAFSAAIRELFSRAELEGFTPPDLQSVSDAIPDGYLESEVRLASETEWIQ
jgi:hypothetical protein